MDPQPSVRPLWLVLLGAVLGLFSLHVVRAWDFTADDAAVAFTYARNLTEGHGYVLSPGAERVEAPESLLWVLLLTLASPLHLGHELFAKILGLVLGAGALVAIAVFPSVAYGRRPRVFDLVAPALAATFAHLALWTASGVETALSAALAALSLLAFAWEEATPQRAPVSSLALSALFAARPDSTTLLVVVAVKVARAFRHGPRRQDAFWILGVAVAVGSIELFRFAYFAAALPNGVPTVPQFNPSHSLAWARAFHLVPLLVIAPIALLSRRAWPARAALALFVAVGLLTPRLRVGERIDTWRDLAPLTPLLCLLVGEALRVALRAVLGVIPPSRRRVAAVALSLLATGGFTREATHASSERFAALRGHSPLALGASRRRVSYLDAAARSLDLHSAITHATAPEVSPVVSVLDPALGALSYGTHLRVIDPWGLADDAIAHTRNHDPSGLLEAIFLERRPALIRVTDTELPPSPALERLYLPLPARIDGHDEASVYRVRRELLAAPWIELATTLTDPAPGSPDRVTVATDALSPGEALSVVLSFTDPARVPTDSAVLAVADDGTALREGAPLGGAVLAHDVFAPGERPIVRVQLRLRPGHHRLTWQGNGRAIPLGAVRVAAGAGTIASAEARTHLIALLARDQVREARSVALRLLARIADAPDDPNARDALTHLARVLASRAARLGDVGAFTEAADLIREAHRYAASDPEATALVERVIESMADASRHAEHRSDAAATFSLARNAVLLDPRRSWLRRRAETWRMRASRYDVAHDARAYDAACAALRDGDLDTALTALGEVSRWREAAALCERIGRSPGTAPAARAVLRGLLGRGEFAEARALADRFACETIADSALTRALRAASWRGVCPTTREPDAR